MRFIEEEKPVCSIIIDDKEYFFKKLTVDISIGWRDVPLSLYVPPKSYVEKERFPFDDVIRVKLEKPSKKITIDDARNFRIGTKINKINNLNEEAPYNSIIFGDRDGAFIIDRVSVDFDYNFVEVDLRGLYNTISLKPQEGISCID